MTLTFFWTYCIFLCRQPNPTFTAWDWPYSTHLRKAVMSMGNIMMNTGQVFVPEKHPNFSAVS